jgi:hypothetical protein
MLPLLSVRLIGACVFVTFLLINNIEHSPFLDISSWSAAQESCCPIGFRAVNIVIHKDPLVDLILSHRNLFQVRPYISAIHFHILYPSTSKLPKWSLKTKTKLHGLSPRANYRDRATAACRRSDCQLFADRWCHVVSSLQIYRLKFGTDLYISPLPFFLLSRPYVLHLLTK